MDSLRYSVAADPRERAEMNALLEATDQGNARLVHAKIEGGANPDAVVDKAHPPAPRSDGMDWAKWSGWSAAALRVLVRGPLLNTLNPNGTVASTSG